MLVMKISERDCPGCGLGSMIFLRADEESEKILTSVREPWKDRMCLLATARASISAS